MLICRSLSTSKLYINPLQISTLSFNPLHVQKKVAGGTLANPMPRPLPTLNLRPDFYAVAEGEHHPAERINCCVIHKPVEHLLVKIHRQFSRLAKPRKESAENVIMDFLPFPLFFQAVGCPSGSPKQRSSWHTNVLYAFCSSLTGVRSPIRHLSEQNLFSLLPLFCITSFPHCRQM